MAFQPEKSVSRTLTLNYYTQFPQWRLQRVGSKERIWLSLWRIESLALSSFRKFKKQNGEKIKQYGAREQRYKERKEKRSMPVVEGRGSIHLLWHARGLAWCQHLPSLGDGQHWASWAFCHVQSRQHGAVGKTFVLKLDRYRFSLWHM